MLDALSLGANRAVIFIMIILYYMNDIKSTPFLFMLSFLYLILFRLSLLIMLGIREKLPFSCVVPTCSSQSAST